MQDQSPHSDSENICQQTMTQEGVVLSSTSSKDNSTTTSITHQGKLISDAAACPQDIAYPTNLNLLNDAREKSEELFDVLCKPHLPLTKPRTYLEVVLTD